VEAPIGLGRKAARVNEGGAPPAPGEPCAPLGLEGFGDFDVVSTVLAVGGLLTFGDSLSTEALLVEESGLIS
jgi:hypothetical protein